MSWDYNFTQKAVKQLKKLDKSAQKRIIAFLDNRVLGAEDPFQWGKELKGDLKGLWRYRVDDYRIVCQVQNEELIVLVVRVNHRKNIYR